MTDETDRVDYPVKLEPRHSVGMLNVSHSYLCCCKQQHVDEVGT